MKILYVYNEPRGKGGATNSTRKTVSAMRSQGCQVEIFSRCSRSLPPNVLGRLRAGANTFYPRGTIRELAETLGRFQPDIVHVYELFPLISPWILPECTKQHIPIVMNCDDYHLTCPVRNHFRDGRICTECIDYGEHRAVRHNCRKNLPESFTLAAYNAMVRRFALCKRHVDHYIVASEFSRLWLSRHTSLPVEVISVIPPVFEMAGESADPALGAYVGYSGRFVEEKGIDIFLEAVKLSKVPFRLSRNRDFLVSVSVPVPEEAEIVTQNEDELGTFYRNCRMLVVPSLWFETFGMVCAEAMGHGIPVILSRIGALSSLIEDGVEGLYFEPGDVHDLAAKIMLLWNNPDLCRRMGQAARERVKRLWRQDQFIDRLLAVYKRVSDKRTDYVRSFPSV